jgi:thioesterase domain-containing protein
MVLNQLPLTASGKLDRRGLPVPLDRPDESGEYVAPRTELERRLADIFAQVLRVDQVGVKDNFFDLGGHSLLATQAVSRIRQEIGGTLDLPTFLSDSTVASIANSLSRRDNAPELPGRILLRASSASRHAVCFPPTSLGLGTHFKRIAERLRTPANFYTCSLPGLLAGEQPHETIEAIASHCLQQFTSFADYDEWSLVGWSFSGFLAHELALQMSQKGFRIRWLVLVDTYLPPPGVMRQLCDDQDALERALSTIVSTASLDAEYRRDTALRMFRLHLLAMEDYRPAAFWGPTVEIRAEQSAALLRQEAAAPRPLSANTVRFITLPGTHNSIMEDNSTAELARMVDEALRSTA